MRTVAAEICETLEAEGYLVTRATDQHVAFRTGRGPAGSFERALIKHGAEKGATAAGVFAERVAGGLELISIDGNVQRNYRVKTARRNGEGAVDLVCGAGSTLLSTAPSESLLWEERWVLGFTMADDHTVDEIFIAEVIGHYGENPVHLRLGDLIPLAPAPAPLGFTSAEEDLEGFEHDDSAADGGTGVA